MPSAGLPTTTHTSNHSLDRHGRSRARSASRHPRSSSTLPAVRSCSGLVRVAEYENGSTTAASATKCSRRTVLVPIPAGDSCRDRRASPPDGQQRADASMTTRPVAGHRTRAYQPGCQNEQVEQIVVCFDADDAGRTGSQKLTELLREQRSLVEELVPPTSLDLTDWARAQHDNFAVSLATLTSTGNLATGDRQTVAPIDRLLSIEIQCRIRASRQRARDRGGIGRGARCRLRHSTATSSTRAWRRGTFARAGTS